MEKKVKKEAEWNIALTILMSLFILGLFAIVYIIIAGPIK